MSLAELLPEILALSVGEQKQLLDILRAELRECKPALGEPPPHLRAQIVPGAEYPIVTPLDCYEAAFILQRMRDEGQSPQ